MARIPHIALGAIAYVVMVAGAPADDLIIWANNGEDKVTQDDLRAAADPGLVVNSVWNGSQVSLFGGRNETVSFCLIIESPTQPTTDVSVAFDTLTGPGGATIHSIPAVGEGVFNWVDRPIELFYVRYLQILGLGQLVYEDYDERHVPERLRRPWSGEGWADPETGWVDRPDHDKYYPDIAIPLELETPFDIAADRSQCVWVDIYIPKTSPPGEYAGIVTITVDGGSPQQVPVSLEVLGFMLPDEPTPKTMLYIEHSDVDRRYLGQDYPWEPDLLEQSRQIRNKHVQMAHRHRISIIGDGYEAPNDYPASEWLPRFSGELFTPANGYDGPGVGVGNGVYSVGTYSSWDWQDQGQAGMWAHTDAWVDWFDTNAPDVDYFLYLIDESGNFPQIEEWAGWIESNPGSGQRMQSFATLDYFDGVTQTPSLDIPCQGRTVCPTDEAENAAQQVLADPEKRLWFYNGARPGLGSFATEDDGVALRVIGWAQFKKHIERWFVWCCTYYNNYQGGMGQTNVFQSAFTFGADAGFDPVYGRTGWNYSNGDGVLFYPGTDTVYPEESYGLSGPFASLRLKHWRRGLQDGEYLALASRINPGEVEQIVNGMIPKVIWEYGVDNPEDPTYVHTDISWPTNPDAWEAARAQLAEIIGCGGDLDGDGTLGPADFEAFSTCIAGPIIGIAAECACADLDHDDDADLADFAALQRLLGMAGT